jgi:diphthamide biosynthesis protein 2
VEVFVLVACPQTALLDSREFLAPIITVFEAELAFTPGSAWQPGAYRTGFSDTPLPADDGVRPHAAYASADSDADASDADLSSSTQLTVRQLSHGRGTLMALTPHVPLRRCNPDGRCRAALRAAT